MSGEGVVDGGFAIGGLVDAADIEGGSGVGLRDGDKGGTAPLRLPSGGEGG